MCSWTLAGSTQDAATARGVFPTISSPGSSTASYFHDRHKIRRHLLFAHQEEAITVLCGGRLRLESFVSPAIVYPLPTAVQLDTDTATKFHQPPRYEDLDGSLTLKGAMQAVWCAPWASMLAPSKSIERDVAIQAAALVTAGQSDELSTVVVALGAEPNGEPRRATGAKPSRRAVTCLNLIHRSQKQYRLTTLPDQSKVGRLSKISAHDFSIRKPAKQRYQLKLHARMRK